MKKYLIPLLFLLSPALAFAQLTVPQGGTGTTTFPANYVLIGSSALRVTAVPQSSLVVTAAFSTTSADYWISASSTIPKTNLSQTWTALQTFQSGLISQASSTFSALLNLTNASSSLFTVSTNTWFPYLGTPAGTILAVDPSGKLIATSTSSGGVTSVTATAPIMSSGGATPNISTSFTTSTVNVFTALNTFANASTTLLSSGTTWFTSLANRVLAVDGNGLVIGTSTPTAATFQATSTTAASNFPYASTTALSWTATSTGTSGINLSGGCFAIAGNCLVSNTSGLTGSGVNGMMTAWSGTNSLIATSTIIGGQFIATSSVASSTFVGVEATTLNVSGAATSTSIVGNVLIRGNLQVNGTFFAPVSLLAGGDLNMATHNITNVGGLSGTFITALINGGTATSTWNTTGAVVYYDGTTLSNTSTFKFTKAGENLLVTNASTTNVSASASLYAQDGRIYGKQDKSFTIASSTIAYFGGPTATTTYMLWNPQRAITITDSYCKGVGPAGGPVAGTSTMIVGSGSASSTLICGGQVPGSATGLSISVAARGNVYFEFGNGAGAATAFTPTISFTSP